MQFYFCYKDDYCFVCSEEELAALPDRDSIEASKCHDEHAAKRLLQDVCKTMYNDKSGRI